MKKIDDFKKDLKELLIKYDAHIDFSVGECSDTHWLYDEHMEVSFYELTEGARFKTVTETAILSDAWGVDQSDL